VQKIKTILALVNESQAIRPILLPWLVFFLKTSLDGTELWSTQKEKNEMGDLNS
jgi:hypothetical protein